VNRLRALLAGANRLQQGTTFKVAASVLVLVAAIALIATYTIAKTAPAAPEAGAPAPAAAPSAAPAAPEAQPESEQEKAVRSAYEATARIADDILNRRAGPGNIAIGVALGALLGLVIVWLGLGLTYLALITVAVGLAWPLRLLGLPGLSTFLLGLVALTASFTALMQGLRLLLSGPGPVLAIARNMLAEAVRMKISLVFIVILLFGLAALPLLMDPTTPLRYRVQAFLQYGTAGSYWIIAILTLFFAAASVAFEQRDKQIWQTMTKPVSPWQYVLGKWLGAAGLSAVLLTVCFAGVFLFTEYLRRQPALGETPELIEARVLSEDRRVLESQVLAARRSVGPVMPISPGDEVFQGWLKNYIEEYRKLQPGFASDPSEFQKVASDVWKSYEQSYRTIAPGDFRAFTFTGLGEARRRNAPLTLRYKVDAGSNMPDQLYHITFLANGMLIQPPAEATLGVTHKLDLSPTMIDENGRIELTVYNAGLQPDAQGTVLITHANPESMSFPSDGLEFDFPAGTYQANFARIAFLLWIKLAFLAMLAIAAATFLSFPVACLVAFSVFLMAEGTGFLSNSLEYYDAADPTGKIQYWKIPVRAIGLGVTWMFRTYADLKPTTRLVDGRILDWARVSWGAVVLIAWTGALFAVGVGIFRRRELATYSGQ
jgi:ABC-type transport system involved in multi-copper enzyme maturation permease subunit